MSPLVIKITGNFCSRFKKQNKPDSTLTPFWKDLDPKSYV